MLLCKTDSNDNVAMLNDFADGLICRSINAEVYEELFQASCDNRLLQPCTARTV